jgi:hypothetical protein
MRALFPALAAVVILAAGCGSGSGSDDKNVSTVSSGEVESSLLAKLSAGSGNGGVVELGTGPPKLVSCVKDAGRKNGWRCTVKPTTGKNVLCLVEVDPQTKKARKTTCTRIDN